MEAQTSAGTRPGTVVIMCALAVFLVLYPGGAFAGFALSVFAGIVVGVRPDLRHQPEMIFITLPAIGFTGLMSVLITMAM